MLAQRFEAHLDALEVVTGRNGHDEPSASAGLAAWGAQVADDLPAGPLEALRRSEQRSSSDDADTGSSCRNGN